MALIAGSNEFNAGICQVKDLASGGQQNVLLEPDAKSLIGAIREILGGT